MFQFYPMLWLCELLFLGTSENVSPLASIQVVRVIKRNRVCTTLPYSCRFGGCLGRHMVLNCLFVCLSVCFVQRFEVTHNLSLSQDMPGISYPSLPSSLRLSSVSSVTYSDKASAPWPCHCGTIRYAPNQKDVQQTRALSVSISVSISPCLASLSSVLQA